MVSTWVRFSRREQITKHNQIMETKEFQSKLRRLFNEGGIITITWDEFRYILTHFKNTTKEEFNIITSTFDTTTIKLWQI